MGIKVYKKWLNVMKKIGYIQKAGKVNYGGTKYNYLKEADVKTKVQEALVEEGLVMIASLTSHKREQFTSEKGGLTNCSTVQVSYTVIDAESGESLTFESVGVAQDNGDKDTAKAYAFAYKAALTQSLSIPTGDDPEADDEQHDNPRESLKKADIQKLTGLYDKVSGIDGVEKKHLDSLARFLSGNKHDAQITAKWIVWCEKQTDSINEADDSFMGDEK